MKVETRLCLRMAAGLALGPITDPLDLATGLPRLSDAEDQRAAHFETLLLLADEDTVNAARAWQHDVWALHSFLAIDGPKQGFVEAFKKAGTSRDRFHEAARNALTVVGPLGRPGQYDNGRATF